MTFEYYPETDTLYIAFRPGPSADADEVAPDFILDYNADGHVIGMTVEHASQKTDLRTLSALKISALVAES